MTGAMRTATLAFSALLAAALLPGAARAQWIDEAKLGVLAHDVPIGGDHKERGADVNLEALFASPRLLAPILAPRPHLGVTIHPEGGSSSYAYAGLTWSGTFLRALLTPQDGVFASLGLGGAIHNGPNASDRPDRKSLGTRLLFHEYAELGYRLTPPLSLALFLDHISNANIGRHNAGVTNLGLRAGWRF
jgi:lipid A 3-O-deacylase